MRPVAAIMLALPLAIAATPVRPQDAEACVNEVRRLVERFPLDEQGEQATADRGRGRGAQGRVADRGPASRHRPADRGSPQQRRARRRCRLHGAPERRAHGPARGWAGRRPTGDSHGRRPTRWDQRAGQLCRLHRSEPRCDHRRRGRPPLPWEHRRWDYRVDRRWNERRQRLVRRRWLIAPGRAGSTGLVAAVAQPAPARDVAVVLGQGRGEGMAAGAVGDEVEIVDRRRIQRRRQSTAPGLAIGPGGRPAMR